MFLHIYSLQKPKFYEEAQAATLKTKMGELTILDHHRPLIAALVKGPITVTPKTGEKIIFEAEGGVLEVRPGNEVNILAD